jgi:hypothetical protein
MLRKLTLAAGLVWSIAGTATAAEAGRVVFVTGQAQVGRHAAAQDAAVGEGDELSTGADGYIYVRTVDNGFLILRPNSTARVVAYSIDRDDPAKTQVKLELLQGVARTISGQGVKQARQHFRFNTPVAAIGVRGTDFTVFTDSDTSRVAVISGGIIVSGFTGACQPDGGGPCEGGTSRELSAAQRGQLLQVRRGQNAPQLLQSSPLSPDQVSPPRPDEPVAKSGSVNGGAAIASADPDLEAQKAASLASALEQAPAPVPLPPPEVVSPPPIIVTPQPERGIVWGRWQQIGGNLARIDLGAESQKNELLAINGNYALFRTPGQDYIAPNEGSIGFVLRDSEAFVYTDYGYSSRVSSPASLVNGRLNVNFGSRAFETSLDLINNGETTQLHAQGAVGNDGRLYGDAANSRIGFMNVQGLLSRDKGGSASYIFDARLDALRTVNGATYWRAP